MICFIYILYNFLIQKAAQITNVSIVIHFDTKKSPYWLNYLLNYNYIGISTSKSGHIIVSALIIVRRIGMTKTPVKLGVSKNS